MLELSLREAVVLKHRFIGPEHILLGLLREGSGLAAKILSEEGLDFTVLRRQAVAALDKAA
ncbi:Clp protease N-terminal domain-containing protein [Planosporangium mesophilum]|uniref:Clp protease N-terminal domain-containing protein n=1 Tax=Planosporangium mesophilum TaxID=689768 RepID=UPI004032B7EB